MKRTNDIIRRSRKKLSEKDFERAAARQMQTLAALALFADGDETSREERREKAESDFDYFCRTYFPHSITDEKAEWHDEFDRELEITDSPLAVTAMRGGGKTTRTVLHELWWIVYRKKEFIVHAFDTQDKASLITQQILIELQYNERLKHDYGLMVSMKAAIGDYQCFDPDTHKPTTKVLAFGIFMSFRGLINQFGRPDAIVIEDAQDRYSAESEARTQHILRIILRDALPAMRPQGTTFIILGNIICDGSVMDELLSEKKHPNFRKRRYPAIVTENGVRRSTFPSRFSLEWLDKRKEEMGDDGFDVEYMCVAVEIGNVFKREKHLHYWTMLPQEIDLHNKNIICQIDSAESGASDYWAALIGIPYVHDANRKDYGEWKDASGEKLGEGCYTIVVGVICRHLDLDEGIAASYDLAEFWNAADMIWDGSVDKETIFERFIGAYEARTKRRRSYSFQKFTTNKESRIKALAPRMARRRVLLPTYASADMQNLEKQLLRFGKQGQPDDGPDALAALDENLDPEAGGASEAKILG